ncbi:hypothetical protein [Szabonella alba]|uniref:Uncharacterized protein n=1 Tax=Szabonella alba TaxID=2804194 RepID=A0A8K0V4E4_9RHOB|nr:hypothetical protein [Szabonella alba]MBL4915624.1 hypothetical protein [Szabonella alba]
MDQDTIRKQVKEAQSALRKLETEMRKPAKLLKAGALDEKKAKAAAAKVSAFLKRYKALAKAQDSKDFAKWPEEVQGDVVWAEAMLSELLELEAELFAALKLAKKAKGRVGKDPGKVYTLLVKSGRGPASDAKSLPKGIGTLLKEMKKGQEIGGIDGAMISLLPAVILLWLIADTMLRFAKSRR